MTVLKKLFGFRLAGCWQRAAWCATSLWLVGGSSAFAQDSGGGRTVTVTYYWVDSILVAALVLAALFAICRSSRRT